MRTSVLGCFWCLKQNDVDIDDPNKATAQFRNKIYGFCNANISNVVDLLMAWIGFTKEAGMPGTLPDRIVAVTKLADKLSTTPGMIQPTSVPPENLNAPGLPRSPTSNLSGAKAATGTVAAPTSSATPQSATDTCWGADFCNFALRKFPICFDALAEFHDPNNITSKSLQYEKCLCGPGYKK